MNSILPTIERKGAAMTTTPARHSTLRAAAQRLSLRNVDQSIVELLNEALARLTMLCYERDDDGRLCNVDPANGRLLIPAPFGRAGHKLWGLRPSEANVFRLIMFTRQRQGIPLFYYDRSRRCWYFNLADYPDGAQVLAQLGEWEIGVGEYRSSRAEVLGQ